MVIVNACIYLFQPYLFHLDFIIVSAIFIVDNVQARITIFHHPRNLFECATPVLGSSQADKIIDNNLCIINT